MLHISEEIKRNKLCMLFWDEQIDHELDMPLDLIYEPVGEMGIYSKEYSFCLPYRGDDNRLKGLVAVFLLKITSAEMQNGSIAGIKNDNCYYTLLLTIKKDNKKILASKVQLFSCEEPEYWGTESALRLFLT